MRAVIFSALILVGCPGKQAPSPASPVMAKAAPAEYAAQPSKQAEEHPDSAPTSQPSGSIDALERDLSIAELRMDEMIARKDDRAPSSMDQRPVRPGTVQPAPPRAEIEQASGSRCDIACRAFHSMRRAANSLCEVAGDGDERCRRARERVNRASQRITDAGCRCIEN
jgi:hypothetical protein